MSPIGNDIVDLTDPLNIGKSRDSRFLRRVFTLPEQNRIAAADKPERTLWAYWAAKETACKIVRKLRSDASFLPNTYKVNLTNNLRDNGCTASCSGRVDIPCAGGPVHVAILTAEDYIHCLGSFSAPDVPGAPASWSDIFWKVEQCIPVNQASSVDLSVMGRMKLTCRLSALLNCRREDLEIRRPQAQAGLAPPLLYLKGNLLPIDISLSHDGVHTAYAFRLTGHVPQG